MKRLVIGIGISTLTVVAILATLVILGDGEEHADRPRGTSWTPLHLAAKRRNAELASVLLSKGAKVNQENLEGETPLFLASQNVIENAEDRKVSVDPFPLVVVLIKHGADYGRRSKEMKTPFIQTAVSGDEPEVLGILLRAGSDIEAHDNEGYTALHWAVWNLRPKSVRFLIEHKANVNAKTARGKTPLALLQGESKDVDVNDKRAIETLLKDAGGSSRQRPTIAN